MDLRKELMLVWFNLVMEAGPGLKFKKKKTY
jgi:hypothetical protein